MEFLHDLARQRGAKCVRLRVHPENGKAISLYQSLGYRFEDPTANPLVGFLELEPEPERSANP